MSHPLAILDRAVIRRRRRALGELGVRLAAAGGGPRPLEWFTSAEAALLEEVGALSREGKASELRVSLSVLTPPDGAAVVVAHDPAERLEALDSVMPPDGASRRVMHASPRAALSWLDVGTGSGVVALAAARAGTPRVVACDINPRTCGFVDLGAALSGVEVEVRQSDLLSELPPERHQVITFAVPQLYGVAADAPIWRASAEGPGLLTRFLAALPEVLAEQRDAEVVLNVELGFAPLHETGLPGLARPADWRVLRVRCIEGNEYVAGLLWLARRRTRSWWAELDLPASADAPFVPRSRLLELIAANDAGD